MKHRDGAMHVDTSRRRYTAADGSTTVYERHLLRRSFRDQDGRPQKETLANLSMLPSGAVEALRKALSGTVLVDADEVFEIERALPHGDVAAVHAMASKLGVKKILGPDCRERDLAYALILSRVVRPKSKLSTVGWWDDTTLGQDLNVAGASTDEVYAAMDWLLERQDGIEAALARRHLRPGGVAMFDLSSSWLEGRCCELAAFGYSRDGKRGRKQIEYGLLTDVEGRPVAIRLCAGNTSDTKAFKEAVTIVREKFGLDRMVMVGDRGMITEARVKELRELDGMDWVTALRAPAIAALACDDGPLQMSLFDTQNFAEITHPDYPGERLICCRNPVLADERARKRGELVQATVRDLDKIVARVGKGRLRGRDDIGIAVGKIINKRKVAKHFVLEIGDDTFGYRLDEEKITAEASLDGIYVIRTSLAEETLGSGGVVASYKSLASVERDFRIIKVDDLDLRPVFHYLGGRVRAHVLLCMLASYVVWHLRDALAELTFTDERIPHRDDPIEPARRSDSAKRKDAVKHTPDGLPVRSFRNLIEHLRTLNRETVNFAGQRLEKITMPTPTQRRVFELLDVPIPMTLVGG
ncbi:IS1634 family transposase [Acrocarpospora sp. B8E8]|uniref:IS1634 family transposase n=1 Tax=Acrocarpospora sp. B8E8 TaxID=3153572 RepID=UPI00325F3494